MSSSDLANDGSAGYGAENASSFEAHTMLTAPGDWSWKWKYLWGRNKRNGSSGFDDRVLREIRMDKIASFSVTQLCVADSMSAILANLPGISNARRNCRIMDCTACVGGNTISFAKHFHRVTAVELDQSRYDMLRNNVKVCGRAVQSGGQFWAEHVNVICGDCTKVCATLPRQEILFFDPPWGGVDYKKEESVRLYLGSKPLSEVCRDLRDKCTFIALKLPLNADVSHITSSRDVTVTLDRKFRKMWLLVIQYISRKTSEREEEKNTSHANSATKKRDREIGGCVIEKASSRTKKKQKRGLSVDSTAAEVPAKRSGKSPWIKAFSKRMNRPYWFNTVTSESLWHDPTKETRESAAVLPSNEAPVGKNVQSKSTDKDPKM